MAQASARFALRWRSGGSAAVILSVCAAVLPIAPAEAHNLACGDVVSEDTKLDRNLSDCPADGLVIGADGVRLDLNGHTIDGDGRDVGSPADDGVDNSAGFDDVQVVNGRIQEFEVGVLLGNFPDFGGPATRNQLRRLELLDSDNGVMLIDSHGNRISHSRIDQAPGGGVGISLVNGSSDNVIAANNVTGTGFGIEVTGPRNRVLSNLASENCVGIHLFFGDDNEVVGNRLLDNNCVGIQLAGAHDNRVVANRVRGYGEQGVRLFGSTGNLLGGNRVARTIDIEGSVGTDGFWLDEGSVDNRLVRNEARLNADDGIDVDATGNVLARNRANRNGDFGIEAIAGVIDGGGNRAARNGNPLQCTGVFCR